MKKFLPFLISMTLFIAFLIVPVKYVNKGIPFGITLGDGVNLNETTFKGTTIQDVMLKESQYYPIFGSSELEKKDPFHPYRLFKDLGMKEKPFLIGTGGSTDLIHAINIASHVGQMNHKKIAIIISPQWFAKKGIDDINFSARFSPQQLMDLLDNPNLSNQLKQKFAKRVLQFSAVKNDEVLNRLSAQVIHGETINPSVSEDNLNGWLYKNSLQKNDDFKSRLMIPYNRFASMKVRDLKGKSWKEIRSIAVSYGKKKATNNPYYMRNKYYNMILHHQKKDHRPNEFYTSSPEYNDLQLLLDALKESGADPLFISIPANGLWYDHIGIHEKRRLAVYHKIHQQISSNGFKIYDLTNKEYEPYVLSDAVHIGWKGWVYIDEQMINHIHGTYKQK